MDYRFRFLKNIMGLWMIQEVRRNYNDEYSFADLVDLAGEAKDFRAIVDVNDDRFLKPENMIDEIRNYCIETKQPIPSTPGEVAKCVYDSLAESYLETVTEIEDIYERKFPKINVIGGGCQNEMLNQLIATVTDKEVYAGPVEATAIGNIAAQLMALGEIKDIHDARLTIQKSFDVKKYVPNTKVTY
jgi:rhamnulokinase